MIETARIVPMPMPKDRQRWCQECGVMFSEWNVTCNGDIGVCDICREENAELLQIQSSVTPCQN